MRLPSVCVVALLLACVLSLASAYFLPGIAPRVYQAYEPVELKVNKLTSVKAQLPFSYYSLPVCKPKSIVRSFQSLGEVLAGDVIESSLFDVKLLVPIKCAVLCRRKYNAMERALFRDRIANHYMVHWLLDNLPAGVKVPNFGGEQEIYELGFPLGSEVSDPTSDNRRIFYLFNHVRIRIYVRTSPDLFEGYNIVRFEVEPYSIQHGSVDNLLRCSQTDLEQRNQNPQQIDTSDGTPADQLDTEVTWTYDVEFVESEVTWTSRWDVFMSTNSDYPIHWFPTANSAVVVFFLTGMIAIIMKRTLQGDVARYNAFAGTTVGGYLNAAGMALLDRTGAQEVGWKLLAADVFRPPQTSPLLLSVFVGAGVQILISLVLYLLLAALGGLSPENRGDQTNKVILLFFACSPIAGYSSARLYKMMKGGRRRGNMVLSAFLLPAFIFAIFFFVNVILQSAESSAGVAFPAIFALGVAWLCVYVPLVRIGSYFGFKKDEITMGHYNETSRQIPPQKWYLRSVCVAMVGGLLPFGALFVEMFFIMSAFWGHRVYNLHGFALLVLLLLIITCAEVTVVIVYFQLCDEEYRWWWHSFFIPGSSGIYLFLYSCIFFNSKLNLSGYEAVVQYFAYQVALSVCVSLLTGAVGFLATLQFVRTIYASSRQRKELIMTETGHESLIGA